jgi:QueT transporter
VTSTRSAIEITVLEEKQVNKSLVIATASIYAAMYVVLVLVFGFISYGPINIRVANILIGLVPIIGWPAILGQGLGVFIANQPALGDPLGPIDLLNVVPSVIFSWLIWKLRKKSVFLGLTLYSLALGVTVSLALNYVGFLGSPYGVYVAFGYVTVGIFIATAILGYILYNSVKRLGILQRRFPD